MERVSRRIRKNNGVRIVRPFSHNFVRNVEQIILFCKLITVQSFSSPIYQRCKIKCAYILHKYECATIMLQFICSNLQIQYSEKENDHPSVLVKVKIRCIVIVTMAANRINCWTLHIVKVYKRNNILFIYSVMIICLFVFFRCPQIIAMGYFDKHFRIRYLVNSIHLYSEIFIQRAYW